MVRPTLDPPPVEVGSQMTVPGVEYQFHVQTVVPFTDSVGLAEDTDEPGPTNPTDEDHPPGGDRERFGRDDITRRQFLQTLPTPVLRRRQSAQTGMDVLGVDRLLQHGQFATEVAGPVELSL